MAPVGARRPAVKERHVTPTRRLTRLALLIALTTVATMAIRVPAPRTGGYINLGDSVVYISALLFGSRAGLVAGGVGSALADLLGGYSAFAPFTLIIKGIEGVLVGTVGWPAFQRREPRSRAAVGTALLAIGGGGAWMVLGYFVAEAYVLRVGVGAAATEVPGNVFQVVGGAIVAIPVALTLCGVVRRSTAQPTSPRRP